MSCSLRERARLPELDCRRRNSWRHIRVAKGAVWRKCGPKWTIYAQPSRAAQSRLIARGVKIAKEIESLTPDRIRAMLMTLISRVDIRPDCVEISVRRSRLIELLGSDLIDLVIATRDARQRG